MEKQDIINSFLSQDAGKLTEAKTALKALLDARAASFRADSSKFVAKSLFEGMTFQPPGIGAMVTYDGAECVIDKVDGDKLVLKTKEGSLYSVSKDDKKMTFTPPGAKPQGPAGSVGNGLYKDDSNKGMIFTPPGGKTNVKESASRMNEPHEDEHHDEAVGITSKHATGVTSTRPGVTDRHEGDITTKSHKTLHTELKSAGYKHSGSGGYHEYKKGGTTVTVDKHEGRVYVNSGKDEE